MTNLSVTGNAVVGNLLTSGQVSTSGTVSGNMVSANTVTATGNISSAANIIASANIVSANIETGMVSATGNVYGANVSTAGNVYGASLIGGNIYGQNLSLTGNTTINGRITGSEVRMGTDSALTGQGFGAVAIGYNAGSTNQGTNAIAIGAYAGTTSQPNNSVILNASGVALNPSTANAFYVAPVRNDAGNVANVVFYNPGTAELTYANTIGVSGNISAANFIGNGVGLYSVPANTLSGDTLSANITNSSLTTVGTLSALSVVGDVAVVGNLSVTGNATLSGNILGDRIVNGTSEIDIQTPGGNANVTIGGVSNVVVFTIDGIETTGNISATGNITGNYVLGNGAFLTGITSSTSIANGTSNVTIPIASDNVVVGVNGISNVAVFSGQGVSLFGNVNAGNVLTDNLLYANGQPWDLQLPAGANTQVQYNSNNDFGASANFTFNETGSGTLSVGFGLGGNIYTDNLWANSSINANGIVSAVGNITSSANIESANIISGNAYFGNASVAGSVTVNDLTAITFVSAVGNVTAGNISSLGQADITGNLSAGNIFTSGEIVSTGNVSGANINAIGNVLAAGFLGNFLSVSGNATSANVNAGIGNFTGDLFGANLSLTGNATISGRITGSEVRIGTDTGLTNQGYGAVGIGLNAGYQNQGTYAIAIGTNAGATNQGNNSIVLNATGSVINGSTANALFIDPVRNDTTNKANIVFYNSSTKELTYGNTISISGNVSAGNVNTDNIGATGNVTIDGDLTVSGNAYLSGNIVGDRIQNGNTIIDIQTAGGNANVSVGGVANVAVFYTAGLSLPGNVNTGNLLTDNLLYANGQPWDLQLPAGSNTQIQFNDNNDFGASANLTFDTATNILYAGNIASGNTVSAIGNVIGGNIETSGIVSAVANVVAGNLITSGIVSASGNVVGGNIVTLANVAGGNLSATGNAVIDGDLSVTGNAYLSGNIIGDRIQNGTTVIDIQTPDGNANVSVGGVTNVAVFYTEGISLPGNVVTGNLLTDHLLYANGQPWDLQLPAGSNTQIQFNNNNDFGASANLTFDSDTNLFSVNGTANVIGNVIGGNLLTTGIVSATGNITGGNLSGTNIAGTLTTAAQPNITSVGTLTSLNSGTISSSGNVTGANINTSGLISATGNIWGGGVRSTASATEPTNPGQGDIWYNTATDVVYRYTYDGTSYYWVDIQTPVTGNVTTGYVSRTFTTDGTANTYTISTGCSVMNILVFLIRHLMSLN